MLASLTLEFNMPQKGEETAKTQKVKTHSTTGRESSNPKVNWKNNKQLKKTSESSDNVRALQENNASLAAALGENGIVYSNLASFPLSQSS